MMTFGISTHGPFASWSTSLRGRRGHRAFRYSLAYWLFGFWVFELAFWLLAGMAIALYCLGIYVVPTIMKWIGIGLGVAVVTLAASVSIVRGHRVNRRARWAKTRGA